MIESKQIIIGIDGATFDLMDDWVEAGHLPNLEKFYDSGVRSTLETTYPPLTAPAWTSFMTGCNPGKHGVYDFLTSDVQSEDVVNYNSIQPPTVWELMSSAEKKVGLVNVSVTFPPPDINGHVISGLLSTSNRRECARPPGLIEELEEKTGRTWWHEDQKDFSPSDLMKYYEAQMHSNETICEFSLALLEEYDYDCFMVLLDVTDMISHFFWHFMSESHPLHEKRTDKHRDAILNAYKLVDDFVGEVDRRYGSERDILLMSDHGFGPIEKMVNLNNFFQDKGLLKLKNSPLSLIKRGLRKLGITPNNVLKMVENFHLDFLVFWVHKSLRNKIIGAMGNYADVNWEKTLCYSRGHMGQVYLVDRVKQDMDRYKEVREQVANTLRDGLVDPETGRNVVTDIHFREDLYDGPFVEDAPDMFLVMEDWRYIAYPFYSSGPELFFPHIQENRYANHRMNGIFMAKGPSFRSGEKLSDRDIEDVAPTSMYLAGMPVSDYMDGSVIEEGLKASLIEENPPEEKSYEAQDNFSSDTPTDSEESRERLKSLGYLGGD